MRNDEKLANEIRRELDREFSFLDQTPSLHNPIIGQIRAEKERRRKRTVSAAVAAAVVLMAMTGLAVSVLSGFVFLDQAEHGQLYACVVKEDHLYVLGQNGLWVYPPGSERAEQLVRREKLPRFSNPLRLELLASEPLTLLDREAKRIWLLEEDGFSLKMSYANTKLAKVDERGTDFVWQDGRLFIQSDYEGEVYCADLDSGTAERMSVEHVTRLANYKPGMLLALTYTEQQGTTVVVISTASGEQQVLCSDPGLGIKGVSYAEKKDEIYAVVSGVLSSWDGMGWQAICGAALPHGTFFCGAFGDAYAAVNYEGIQFVPLNGMDETLETIVIQGAADSAAYDHGFQQSFPGITIARRSEADFTVEDAVRALHSGSEADLFHVRITSNDAEKLWQMTEPITSERLRTDVCEMLPVLQSLLMQQGRLYAVPSSMLVEAWKMENGQQAAVPSALRDVLMTKQYAIGEETFEGAEQVTVLWQQEEYAVYLLKQALREKKAGTRRLTDQAFAEMLEALKVWKAPAPETAGPVWYHTSVSLVGYLYGSNGVIPYTMPPLLEPEASCYIPANVTVYVLNPNSRQKEAAIRYLEYVAANRFSWEDALMKPYTAKPVLIQWARERINELGEEDRQRREIEENPENWEVLAENLCFYREKMAPNIVIGDGSVHELSDTERSMLSILMEYLDGEISVGECVSQLEQMAECAILESAFI